MGKVHIGSQDNTRLTKKQMKSVAQEVVYVDRPIETIVERVVEIDRPVDRMVEMIVQAAPEIQERIVLVQDPELLKQVETMEYASIQKDIDHKRSVNKYEKHIESIDDELLVTTSSLIRSRSQHMISQKHKEELFAKLREEKCKRIKSDIKFKIAMGAILILSVCIVL